MFYTKHWVEQSKFRHLMPKSILFQKTDDEDYKAKRKDLSSAFSKKEMKEICETIKKVSLEHMRETHSEEVIDLPAYMIEL